MISESASIGSVAAGPDQADSLGESLLSPDSLAEREGFEPSVHHLAGRPDIDFAQRVLA
jgi:hypothetical protein